MVNEKSVQNWFVVKDVEGIKHSERGFPEQVYVKSAGYIFEVTDVRVGKCI